MADDDAKVTIGADASAVERAVAVVKVAGRDLKNSLTSEIGAAAKAVTNDLANVAFSAGKISFSAQHSQVREFEASSAKLAIAMGRDLGQVRGSLDATGLALGKRPQEVAAWASSVGQLTYNFGGAVEAMRGITGLAAETGRNADDYRGLAVELGTVGKVTGDTSHAIGVLKSQSDMLGTAGGVAAFANQVEGLSDTISHFAVSSEKDFLKVTAAAAVLGKGLSPQAAQRVQQSALGSIAADPAGWSRFLGKDITNEQGQIADPTKVLQDITEKIKKAYGKDARRMLQLQFGSEAGAALYKTDFGEMQRAAAAAPSLKPEEKRKELAATDAGQRQAADAQLAVSSEKLLGSSSALGRAADALQGFAAKNPITSTILSGALSGGMSAFLSKFGADLSKMMGGKGEGGGVGGAIELATKGTKLGGVAGALGKVGSVGAAFGVGYSAGTALDEATGLSDLISGTGQHSRIKSESDKADVMRDVALKGRIAGEREAAKRKVALLEATGLTHGQAVFKAASDKTIDYDKLAAAVAKAVKEGVKVEVTNAADTPIAATVKGASSAAAGSQG